MTEPGTVTVADTVHWLHDEGLIRLSSVAWPTIETILAYTVAIATGTITAYPAVGNATGSDPLTVEADDLPQPVGTPKRLVVVGLTMSDAMLVLDLAAVTALALNADRPEVTARAWAMQLLLNPEITLTTNSPELAVPAGPRCRHTFIPGGGTLFTVDDSQPPVTTISLNPVIEGPDHLDVAADGTAELYLGTRCWPLRRVLGVEDQVWSALATELETSAAQPDSNPAETAGAHL
ncbi:hypothetical protein [Nocardia sp. NBC_01388]|uniref:hypothetical protein n=1 Tax=Nocardia sp. NBC_01388 TaxID=2903596 RepID=UPI00324B8395